MKINSLEELESVKQNFKKDNEYVKIKTKHVEKIDKNGMTIICRFCREPFVFTNGELEFYKEKGLEFLPCSCKKCRQERKRNRNRR